MRLRPRPSVTQIEYKMTCNPPLNTNLKHKLHISEGHPTSLTNPTLDASCRSSPLRVHHPNCDPSKPRPSTNSRMLASWSVLHERERCKSRPMMRRWIYRLRSKPLDILIVSSRDEVRRFWERLGLRGLSARKQAGQAEFRFIRLSQSSVRNENLPVNGNL